MNTDITADLYDAHYFAHGCGRPYQRDDEWLAFFGNIADRIVTDVQPATVLDAGCAMGFLVEALRERGVEAWGVDISEYAIEKVHSNVAEYCWRGSVTEPLPQDYDLIVCLEVLEHMPAEQAEQAVANFCRYSNDVLFSSTPFDYKEVTHFNVHPPEYWGELFARHGFYRDIDFDASFITPWATRFRHNEQPIHRIVREYERRFWLLWKENTDLRELVQEMRSEFVTNEQTISTLKSERTQLTVQLKESRAQLAKHAETIEEITSSPAWQLIEKFHPLRLRLAPEHSLRERILFKIVHLLTDSAS